MGLSRCLSLHGNFYSRVNTSSLTLDLSNGNSLDWTAPRIASYKSVQDSVTRSLAECPTDFYILAHQPGVNSADYTSRSMPHLKEWLERTSRGINSGLAVSEMVGSIDQALLHKALKSKCGVEKLNVDASGLCRQNLLEKELMRSSCLYQHSSI